MNRRRQSSRWRAAVGQKAVIADVLESRRQSVLQEKRRMNSSAETVISLDLPPSRIVFPLEGDLTILQRQQTAIGDGHAVGIASEVLQHVLGAAEGSFGIDDPFLVFEWRQVLAEGLAVAQRCQLAEELKLFGGVGPL